MKGYYQIYACVFFIVLMTLCSFESIAQKSPDYYTRGNQAALEGNAEEALNIWMKGKGALEAPDVRIGIAFIELVAKEDLKDYYELATLMYQWGLSAEEASIHSKVLKDEIERIKILVDYRTFKRWWNLWKDGNTQIYTELSSFWKQLDPTPDTGYNERLLEHWKRIAYSRKHFNRSKSGAFKADDRAEIYVRYGKPDFTKNGFLNFNSSTAASYIERIANTPNVPIPQASHTQVQAYVRNAQNYYTRPEV